MPPSPRTSPGPRRIVVVGATSALAQHTLREWLAESDADVHLIGRDEARVESVAADLRVRFPASTFDVEALDLVDVQVVDDTTRRLTELSDPDLVLVAHASSLTQAQCESSLRAAAEQLMVTGVSPALWLEGFAERMGTGTVAVIGSVAGDRGRRSNYLYGAGKGMIERVAQGLQNRFFTDGPTIVLIKPGPTRTPLTQALADSGARLADVGAVSIGIARAVTAGRSVAYVPSIWRVVMAGVRSIPAPIFNRLDL